MDIVGIICEYNPFHKGHYYQIRFIKEKMPQAKIVAIMSGNIVQRGEFSIIHKRNRAEIALACGVDLVVEIPYPYCGSTAEVFASAGVKIATSVGCTHLCFGTEKTTIGELEKLLSVIDSKEYEEAFKKTQENSRSYLEAKEEALENLGYKLPKLPNDILALEYLRAIKNQKSSIKCMQIERVGAGYKDKNVCEIMSASAIREHYYKNKKLLSIPDTSVAFYEKIIKNKQVLNVSSAFEFLHKYSLVAKRELLDSAFDSCAEIGAIIKKSANDSKNGEEFVSSLSSRAHTTARIKRSILFSMFEIDHCDKNPKFAILLGSNESGLELVKKVKNNKCFSLVTKAGDEKILDPVSKKYLKSTILVDKMYNSLLQDPTVPSSAYTLKPIIK